MEDKFKFGLFDEKLHEQLIRAYIAAGNYKKAIEHYEYVSEFFSEKLGKELSEEIKKLIKGSAQAPQEPAEDFESVSRDLREPDHVSGAFYCDYEIFKNIYRIEARMAKRLERNLFIALLTLHSMGHSSVQGRQQAISECMALLKIIALSNLRNCDVISRYSASQYILMLPSLTLENGQTVLKRITKKYNDGNRNYQIRLSTKINPLNMK